MLVGAIHLFKMSRNRSAVAPGGKQTVSRGHAGGGWRLRCLRRALNKEGRLEAPIVGFQGPLRLIRGASNEQLDLCIRFVRIDRAEDTCHEA